MSVVRSMEETGAYRKELHIDVPAEALLAETERIVGEYRRGVRLPGFRQGKAPKSLIEKKYGDEIDKEILDRLVPRYCHQAISEKEIEPLMNPRVEKVEHERGESLSFVATVEYRPEFELQGVEALELPDPDCEATVDEVEEALAKVRVDVAPWKDVERAASQGDLATVRISEAPLVELAGSEGAAEPPEEQTVPFEVGDANVWEELSLAVTGLSSGQSGEFERKETQPPAEEGGEPTTTTRKFKVTVDKVAEKDLPELDDALAAKVGDFETLDALKAEIEKQLRDNKRSERSRARESAALEQLAKANPLQLPEGVMQHETETLLREYADNLAGRGVDLETADIDWARMRDELTPQAERRVHSRLILDEVARERQLEVPAEELEQALISIARVQRVSTAELKAGFERDGRIDALREDLLRRKAIRQLTGEEAEAAEESATTDEESASE